MLCIRVVSNDIMCILQVCGTDGVTYNSTCSMRSLSANTRVDYLGECLKLSQNNTIENICESVQEQGKCPHNSTTCRRLAEPQEGCCPVCGEKL